MFGYPPMFNLRCAYRPYLTSNAACRRSILVERGKMFAETATEKHTTWCDQVEHQARASADGEWSGCGSHREVTVIGDLTVAANLLQLDPEGPVSVFVEAARDGRVVLDLVVAGETMQEWAGLFARLGELSS